MSNIKPYSLLFPAVNSPAGTLLPAMQGGRLERPRPLRQVVENLDDMGKNSDEVLAD